MSSSPIICIIPSRLYAIEVNWRCLFAKPVWKERCLRTSWKNLIPVLTLLTNVFLAVYGAHHQSCRSRVPHCLNQWSVAFPWGTKKRRGPFAKYVNTWLKWRKYLRSIQVAPKRKHRNSNMSMTTKPKKVSNSIHIWSRETRDEKPLLNLI